MNSFFEGNEWSNLLFYYAKRCRTAYIKAKLYKLLKGLLAFITLLLPLIALFQDIEVSKVFSFTEFAVFAIYLLMDLMQYRSYHIDLSIQPDTLAEEYTQIMKRIMELVQVPDGIKNLNPSLDNHSFALFQIPDIGYLVMFKACMQKFPLYLVTDRVCKLYLDKAVDSDEVLYSIQADLNLEELETKDVIIRFFATQEEAEKEQKLDLEALKKSVENKSEFLEYCVIKVIDRNWPEPIG